MNKKLMDKIRKLRKELHRCPELAGCEKRTIETIKKFLHSNTGVEIVDRGDWFYAVHKEGISDTRTSKYHDGKNENVESILIRAEMDAIASSEGKCFHGCGHDGHCSVVAGLAAALDGIHTGKNIYFLFQHAEENGEGARDCVKLISEQNISRVYGFHNLPGYPAGQILLADGQFASASTGITIRLHGHSCHSAHPEDGVNPSYLLADIITYLRKLCAEEGYKGSVMGSVVHIEAGEQKFSTAAGEGEVSMTLRAEYETDLHILENRLTEFVEEQCEEMRMTFEIEASNVFPDTVNDHALFEKALGICWNKYDYQVLESPMRWSEDFGWYGKQAQSFFVGVGSGEDWPRLHDDAYAFNDEILENTISFLEDLIKCS